MKLKNRPRYQKRIGVKIENNLNKEISHQVNKHDISTQSISEYWFCWLLYGLIPPTICLGQYFVTVTLAISTVLEGFPWPLIAVTIPSLIIALIMLPFWYKTLFDKNYVGADRPLLVQWSNGQIRFKGAFFDIKVPLENILEYKAVSPYTFRAIAPHKVLNHKKWKKTFTLKVKVKKMNGSVENMWLSTTMPKKEELLSFLEENQTLPSVNPALKNTY